MWMDLEKEAWEQGALGRGEVREVLRGRQRREGSGEGGKGLIDAGEDSEE